MRECNIWWLDSTTNKDAEELCRNYYIVSQKKSGEVVLSRFFAPCVLEPAWQTTVATCKKSVDKYGDPKLTVTTKNSTYHFSSSAVDVVDADAIKSLRQYHTRTEGGEIEEVAGYKHLQDKYIVMDFGKYTLKFQYLTHCIGDNGEDGYLSCDNIWVYVDGERRYSIDDVTLSDCIKACQYAQDGTLTEKLHSQEFCVYVYATDEYMYAE